MDTLIQEAVSFIRQHAPLEGYFVGDSGGKDSIVLLELVRMAGVKFEAWHSCTRIDPPEVYTFLREHHPETKWAFPKITFWEGIKRKLPPLRLCRWCCDHLKKNPTKDNPLKHRLMGIRAEESSRRAARGRVEMTHSFGYAPYKPIFDWTEADIWGFIEARDLPYPTLYDEGFDRIGCVICPFIMRSSQGKLYQAMIRWPKMFKCFESAVKTWVETAGRAEGDNRKGTEFSYPAFIAQYYKGFSPDPKSYTPPIRCLADALHMQQEVGHYDKHFPSQTETGLEFLE